MAQTDVVVHNEDVEIFEKYPYVSSEDLRQRFDLVTQIFLWKFEI